MLGQVYQTVLEQMKGISHKSLGVFNNLGDVVAYTDDPISEDLSYEAMTMCPSNNKPYSHKGYTFVGIGVRNLLEYVVYVHGDEPADHKLCALLAVTLSNLQLHCGDKYDRASYIKNILLGNVLPGDVYLKSSELKINMECPRIVFIVQMEEENDLPVMQVLQNLFPEPDFVINIDTSRIVIIKSSTVPFTRESSLKIAKSIVETLSSELMLQVFVGLGTQVESITDIARSYSEAQIALEIGRAFDGEKYILSYDNLGIGRLIYQLPRKLCELFMDEIFKKESINALDAETMQTIHKFFENNLNVSETSRQLFVHRNTLVYRLDKIERLTGLDLRKFDDAVTFKVAMLVDKYLATNPSKF